MTLWSVSFATIAGIGKIKEMAHLLIVRGLPGSGKSTFAKTLGFNHFEADQYFVNDYDEYEFDPRKLINAHEWCQAEVFYALNQNQNTVVSNTFTRIWEIQKYIDYCVANGHTFNVVTCEGDYGSIHGVPKEAIQRMKDRWERYPN